MKHRLAYASAFIIVGLLVISNGLVFKDELLGKVDKVITYSYCEDPVRYRVESIDSRYGMSEDYLLEKSLEAASMWNLAMGEEYFIYDEEGELTISLVYDERQQLTEEIHDLEETVTVEDDDLKSRVEQYEKQSAALNSRIDRLNSDIQYWNKQGSAPQEEYQKITNERKAVDKEILKMKAMADSLNQETVMLNDKIKTYNKTVDTFNETLSSKPEQGLYIGGENPQIEIYIYENEDELVHTIAHEFGHGLGLDHVDNPEAIMYTMTATTTQLSDTDIDLLSDFCQKRNYVEEVIEESGWF